MRLLSELSAADLRRVVTIKEKIESLERQLEALGGEASPTESPAPAKRQLSAAHRRKLIAALVRARKARSEKAKSAAAPKKRRMSKAGRAAIAAAAKARWAKFRAAKT